MSKIKELLRENDNVLVFDMDGVLAVQEWGEYNHFDVTDEEWTRISQTETNFYTEDFVSKKMQDYLRDKDMNKVYVISKAYTQNEIESKDVFAQKYYNIPKENLFYVSKDEDKLEIFKEIVKLYPDLPHHKIIMIEDTVKILNDIKENTDCATVHISSFLDL